MIETLRCLIVDDEPAAHYVLENYIGRMDRLVLAGQCYDAYDFGVTDYLAKPIPFTRFLTLGIAVLMIGFLYRFKKLPNGALLEEPPSFMGTYCT